MNKFALHMVCLWLAVPLLVRADPIRFSSAEATFHGGDEAEFLKVIDGVESGPAGWSQAPKSYEPQSLVVRCARPVEANELDITLFFLAGRPLNMLAEFTLSYTTDAAPSLTGNWQPLEITRFTTDVNTLRRTPSGSLRLDFYSNMITGNRPDDVYRLRALLPGARATGFRLDAIPVQLPGTETRALSWWPPHDFTLTEFRVAVHVRETTNIALYQAVTASHALYIQPELQQPQVAANLTDGLPATIAHPDDPNHGADFFFEIDLGRVAAFDHIGLRNRGDMDTDRMSRLWLRCFELPPAGGSPPVWDARLRADGSHPAPGAVDLVRSGDGSGKFRGRYLRISSESPVPLSPQLAEVEVYETRTPVLISALADGKPLAGRETLTVPPDTRRLALNLEIPQPGMPAGDAFRWRLAGDGDAWQGASRMTLEMACPPAGKYVFEAQALHSDNQWDATVFHLPIIVRQQPWQNPFVQAFGFATAILAALFLSRQAWRRRAARDLAAANARTALAEERSRIARDLHDEIGANLVRISLLTELAGQSIGDPEKTRHQLDRIHGAARDIVRQLDTVVWAVDPANDTLESLARYLHGHAVEYLAIAGIRCGFEADAMPAIPLSSSVRHNLLMIVKEALHNVVKHAGASAVETRMRLEGTTLVLEIEDNGNGIAPAAADDTRHGNGLRNMQKRAATSGGTCTIHPAASGMGTVVRLVVPLPDVPRPGP